MSTDPSKLCADFLRQKHASLSPEKLKASHARELVAAFFGYKSHAALMAEKAYPLQRLEDAYIFIPDLPLLEDRRVKLNNLPANLISSMNIAKLLADFLSGEGLCGGNVWLYDSLESYITDVFLPDSQTLIDDELSGVMAETNAGFFDTPYYDDVKIHDGDDELIITASAQYKGEPLDDKPFCGDTIDMGVQITLPRIAGKRGFYDFELEVGGSINDDWVDPDLKYGKPLQSKLAEELGISDDDLEMLEWETQENSSNDGLIYDFILTFDDTCPPEILGKIEGLSDDKTIRVSANAFDENTQLAEPSTPNDNRGNTMSTYPKRVADNILPLSMAGDLPAAFKEWHFTDKVKDHLKPNEDCELCDNEKLRYHFEIENEITRNRLWIGSSCILKFQVQVFDNKGNVLNAKDTEKKLNKLKDKMCYDACINALKNLAIAEPNEILSNALNYYLKNKYLTPKYAFVVFWRLIKNDIDHSPSFFKVALNKNKYKEHLEEMDTFKVHTFWKALSSSQKKIAERLGHTAPPA